jgi:hypothetical protein
MPDPLKSVSEPVSGSETPRFIYRAPQRRDGGTVVMIAAAVLIALALIYLVLGNLPL